ncbi:hypothetical protein CITRIK5_70169 [Citricoccus sp. K5]|nr:hypothetical protein CITRIK5_70169 [Citricoccus sp. K5]
MVSVREAHLPQTEGTGAGAPDGLRGPWSPSLGAGLHELLRLARRLHLDPPRLRMLRHRYANGENPRLVASSDGSGIELLTEDDLAAEHTAWLLRGQHLGAFGGPWGSLGPDSQGVALDPEIDGVRVHPGQVERDGELVTLPPGFQRHGRGPGAGAQHLLGETVKVAERIGTHQHDDSLPTDDRCIQWSQP